MSNRSLSKEDDESDLVRGKGERFSIAVASILSSPFVGKGLIVLLHGAPGVGKTSTAGKKFKQPLPEHTYNTYARQSAWPKQTASLFSQLLVVRRHSLFRKRIRFINGIGDLGLVAEVVEENLSKMFYLAERWDCVLLLDEADVFLAERTKSDLKRNSLVSGELKPFKVSSKPLINCVSFLTDT